MNKAILIFQIVLICFISKETLATAQYPDILVEGKDTFMLFSNPLEPYLRNKDERSICGNNLEWTSTACYRGYQAIWRIKRNKLYLIEVKRDCGNETNQVYNLKEEFNSKKVFADWYTGTLESPRGEMLQYIHDGYGSLHEGEKLYYITNGLVDSTETRQYLIHANNLLNPTIDFLRDTLEAIIISNLDSNVVSKFSDGEGSIIYVKFNSNGIIDSIYCDFLRANSLSFMDEYLLSIAKNSFNDLPRLMRVEHPLYKYPVVQIYFNSHCLKFPNDKKYGCKEIIFDKSEPVNKRKSYLFFYFGLAACLTIIILFILKMRKKI